MKQKLSISTEIEAEQFAKYWQRIAIIPLLLFVCGPLGVLSVVVTDKLYSVLFGICVCGAPLGLILGPLTLAKLKEFPEGKPFEFYREKLKLWGMVCTAVGVIGIVVIGLMIFFI